MGTTVAGGGARESIAVGTNQSAGGHEDGELGVELVAVTVGLEQPGDITVPGRNYFVR